MLKMFLYLLLACYFFTSCLVTPPTSSSSNKSIDSNLRNIEITCTEKSHCKNKSGKNFEIVAMYTTDECNDIDSSSPIIGFSREDLSCVEGECTGLVKSFKKEGGVVDVITVDDGEYTIAVFIDINKNEFPDKGEPFYCNAEVEISPMKRLTNLAVEIVRKLDI